MVPWLPLADDAGAINVAAQHEDAHSMLSLYRALLTPRRAEPALAVGSYRTVSTSDGVLVYERGDELRVALNLSDDPAKTVAGGVVLLGTDPARCGESLRGELRLAGGEAVIVRTSRGA